MDVIVVKQNDVRRVLVRRYVMAYIKVVVLNLVLNVKDYEQNVLGVAKSDVSIENLKEVLKDIVKKSVNVIVEISTKKRGFKSNDHIK